MAILKKQEWRPDTHPGYVLELEWEYDENTGRDTGREHRGVSIRFPDGLQIHRDTHGADVVHERFNKIHAENVLKNRAYGVIIESLPASMKKPVLDSDHDPVLDEKGRPRMVVKDKHKPEFEHLGNGRYEFFVPGIDEASRRSISEILAQRFGHGVVTLKSA